MRAGRLDRRITIEAKTETQSPSGAVEFLWNVLELRRAAGMMPVRGDERFATPQENASEQIEFRVRYSANLASLNPGDHRVIYPAFNEDDDLTPTVRRIHDIVAVHELGRREGLRIITVRRPDVLLSEGIAPSLDFSRSANSQYLALLEDI